MCDLYAVFMIRDRRNKLRFKKTQCLFCSLRFWWNQLWLCSINILYAIVIQTFPFFMFAFVDKLFDLCLFAGTQKNKYRQHGLHVKLSINNTFDEWFTLFHGSNNKETDWFTIFICSWAQLIRSNLLKLWQSFVNLITKKKRPSFFPSWIFLV